MPEISRFLGTMIGMFFADQDPPHFPAVYGDYRITVDIHSADVRGELPPRALRLVLERAGMHRGELLQNWERARREPLARVAPLE